ncbi:hypothetical protein FPHYL_5052 [Fusarium phyllophilum]|uniref:NACHT domain-containing protein n=1 Tax=Fusarium phyllophilum TaxID=47803 RepID=A0A8H5JYR5_9HYPO|nr:hypothetical protein FPHYL_5052 [Fusarium phyllophilum]
MSGAEAALLGVGILCNAMQILTFAKDSIHVYRNIRDGRAPDPNLDSYLKNAKASFDEMEQTAAQMGPLTKEQQKIVEVGKMVHECVDELQRQFSKLYVDDASKSGLRAKLTASKRSLVALWRGKELRDAENKIRRHEQLLQSLLLDRICNQSQAAEITSLQSFQHLQGSLQGIISQLVDGSINVSELVTNISTDISGRLIEEHATTRSAIDKHVTRAENIICNSISKSLDQLHQELVEHERDKAFKKQHEQILGSLRFLEMNSRKNHISDNYPGTFSWVFDRHGWWNSNLGSSSEPTQTDNNSQLSVYAYVTDMDLRCCTEYTETTGDPGFDCFPCWLESDSNLFWVSGKPASGKSSLMKFLAFNHSTMDHLHSWHPKVRTLTHFFWKPGQLLQRNVEGMVLSLLYQLLDGKPCLGRRLCEAQSSVRQKISYSDWSFGELTNALVWSLENSPEAFCIFLDGLDETKELEHLPWPDWINAEVIHKLLNVNNVKLCASSREEHAFCCFFEKASRLRIYNLNNRDITLFVRERLDICDLSRRNRDRIVYETVQKAEGVFLWAALVVDRLNRAIRQGYTSIETLQERLKQTPSDLTTLYTDMWVRTGDDAHLPSMRGTASLYFNIIIVAREINDYLLGYSYGWGDETVGMSSLLMLATATKDQSMEALLSTGRVLEAEDLLARCPRVSNELKLACRGLLEVTRNRACSPYHLEGDARLCEYNLTQVDFIHRSAFDFLMETEAGLEFLQACGSSESQQALKLVAAHLIRARFIHLRRGLYDEVMERGTLSCYRAIFCDTYLQMAIAISLDTRLFPEDSVRYRLLEVLKEWQSSGRFSGQICRKESISFHSTSNYLQLGFFEARFSVALCRDSFFRNEADLRILLDEYPASIFIEAVPIVLHSIPVLGSYVSYFHDLPELLKFVLRRLQSLATEQPQYQVAVEDSIRALHSWYIIYCLAAIIPGPLHKDFSHNFCRPLDIDLVAQLCNTFHHEEDWQHVLLLEFQAEHMFKSPVIVQHTERLAENSRYALVAVNVATAYRLLDELLSTYTPLTLGIEIPLFVKSRFDVLLLSDVNTKTDFYTPDAIP